MENSRKVQQKLFEYDILTRIFIKIRNLSNNGSKNVL